MRREVFKSGFGVFLALGITLPFVNYLRVVPSPAFYSELAAVTCFLLACAFGGALLPRRQAADWLFAGFACGLLGLLAYQVLAGYYEYMLVWSAWAAFLLFFLMASVFGQLAAADSELRELTVDRLTAAFVLAALFNAFAQVAQVTEWSQQIRPLVFIPSVDKAAGYLCAPAGNVGQRNHANTVAWLGIVGLLYAYVRHQVRLSVALIGLAILLLSSALTSARMAWLMAAALAAVLWVCRRGIAWSGRRVLLTGALVVVGLLAATAARQALLPACSSSLQRMIEGIGGGVANQTSDLGVRLDMARLALGVWLTKPVLGAGAGKFMAEAFELERSRDEVRLIDFYPHNAILEILVSFGAVGAGLLAITATVWSVRAWRKRDASRQQWPLLAGIALIGIHAMLEMPLWYSYFLLPFALMLGLAVGSAPGRTNWLRLPWHWAFPLSALMCAPLIFLAVRDHHRAGHTIWLASIARTPSAEAAVAADKLQVAMQKLTIFAVWGEYEWASLNFDAGEDLDSRLAANRSLLRNFPGPHIVAKQIVLETMKGRHALARDLFRRMMVFFPEEYKQLAERIRVRAQMLGDDGTRLSDMLNEEMARPPRTRGRAFGADAMRSSSSGG